MSTVTAFTPDPGFFERTSLIQLGYGLWTVLTNVGVGLAFGFAAVSLPQLKDPESDMIPTMKEESWIASVLPLSSPVGCLLSGYLIDVLGRRLMLQLCQIPTAVGWALTACAKSPRDVIIGRAVTGFGIGMSIIPPRVYMSEISLPNMRGVIGVFPNLAVAIGITLQAGIGHVKPWRFLCWFGAGYCTVLFFLNFRLPESPYYHLLKGSMEKARLALRRFRSSDYNVEHELNEMIQYKTDNDIRRLSVTQTVIALFHPSACKPFWIIIFYIIIVQLSGLSIFTMYAVEILKDAKARIDPSAGNIILAAIRMIAGTVSSILLFTTGRKTLSVISGLGAGIFCILLGFYAHYGIVKHSIPMLCATAYTGFASIGYYSIPLMLMGEMYPLQVRGVLGGITLSLTNVLIFLATKYYPYMRHHWGFSETIYVFGGSAICGALCLYYILPETKGLTITEIEEYFNGRLTTPMSHRELRSIQLSSSRQPSGHQNVGSAGVKAKNGITSKPRSR